MLRIMTPAATSPNSTDVRLTACFACWQRGLRPGKAVLVSNHVGSNDYRDRTCLKRRN